jgi:hypothetical protein
MTTFKEDYVSAIIECFEELLDEKDISIPSEDRYGDDDEARIYGSEYYELEEKILFLLDKFDEDIRREFLAYCQC